MGLKSKISNSIAVFKKRKEKISISSHSQDDVTSILFGISNFNATLETPKSRVNIVYNFGDYVDLSICFSKIIKKKVYVSKGLSKVLLRKYLTLDEWRELSVLSANNIDAKFIQKESMSPVIVLEGGEGCDRVFCQLLAMCNKWSSENYPLVVGVDVYTVEELNITAINLLSTVLQNNEIKFVFYNRGIRNIDFLNIPSQVSKGISPCPLHFFEGSSKQERYLNTMIELRNLLNQADEENASIYNKILLNLSVDNLGRSIDSIVRRKMNIFDNNLGRFLFPAVAQYRMGYCLESGGRYVEYNKFENRFNTTERFVLVTRDTEIMLNSELITKISRVNVTECRLPNIFLVEGVPGAGKSEYIVTHHSPGRDLVLTQTRAGIGDIRSKVISRYRNGLDLFVDYRTIASYIINGSKKSYDRIFIDEGFMFHAGYIGFVTQLSGASEVIILGDSKQIPYIERSRVKPKWGSLFEFCETNVYLNATKRCPVDICYALSHHYENITTSNDKCLSILPTARDREFHQIEPNTLILTYTQAEKRILLKTLINYKHLRIFTIHEAQGLTERRVVLVRIDSKSADIYSSNPHAVVALTRHTESFKYLTTGDDDEVLRIIKKLEHTDEKSLRQWNLNRLGKALIC